MTAVRFPHFEDAPSRTYYHRQMNEPIKPTGQGVRTVNVAQVVLGSGRRHG